MARVRAIATFAIATNDLALITIDKRNAKMAHIILPITAAHANVMLVVTN